MSKLIRPEIKAEAANALEQLAREAGVTPTEYINELLLKDWQAKHAGMTFPNDEGVLMQIECTPLQDKQ